MLALPNQRLVCPVADDDCHLSKSTCGQMLVLPCRRLMHPAANDDFVLVITNVTLNVKSAASLNTRGSYLFFFISWIE